MTFVRLRRKLGLAKVSESDVEIFYVCRRSRPSCRAGFELDPVALEHF